MQLKKIKVYGKLRQFLGKSYFEAAVNSPQQAMSFLMANFEGLQKHMNDQLYKIKMGGHVITEDYLSMSGEGDIQIIPIATGSGFLVPIIVGAGAAAAGTALTTAFTTGISGFLLGTVLGTGLTAIGTSMIIGGISELIAPQSTQNISSISDIDPAIRGSYAFNGIQNVSSSGVPIPIIYGYVFSGSIIISSGTDTVQITKGISQGDGTTDETTATATATSDNVTGGGSLTGNLSVSDGGTGYSQVPSISITGGGGDASTVFITPTITNGIITNVQVEGGTGFTSPPTITIEEPKGPSDDMTYTQSGNLITIKATNHTFTNGENIDIDFITGPLADANVDGATFGVQDVTENEFRVSTGIWNNQTYSNSGNVLKVTMRNKP